MKKEIDKVKKTILGLLAGLTVACPCIPTAQAAVTGFGDLIITPGSGPNQSGLVIQWNDSKVPAALAWGFNWTSNSTTVNDMLLAVMSADVRLFSRGDSSTPFGPAYFGFGYNNSGNFSVAGAVNELGVPVTPVFVGGFSDMNTDPGTTQAPLTSTAAAPSNPLDRYVEGWNDNGFWELFSGSGPAYPGTWTSSAVGVTETLTQNTWYALSLSNSDFSSNLPGAATAAVPEPIALWLILLAGIIFHASKRLYTH